MPGNLIISSYLRNRDWPQNSVHCNLQRLISREIRSILLQFSLEKVRKSGEERIAVHRTNPPAFQLQVIQTLSKHGQPQDVRLDITIRFTKWRLI